MPIHSHAVDIVERLVKEGHIAYFAGGWVRDYLMGHPSDDIDIATSASPQEILDLFPRTILVGLQFGVVIVAIEGHQYEVSTFRRDLEYINGRKPEKIELASPQEDALRRDFTINGMFFDPLKDELHDYVGGREDIKKQVIRAIGNPDERFFEDRLRMIRAIRFASRFNFHIDQETQEAIQNNASGLFPAVAMERVWQEFCKMNNYPHFDRALIELHRYGLLPIIFPGLKIKKLKELEDYVRPIARYPQNTPTAFFLQEIFPFASLEQITELGKYLKAPNKDLEALQLYLQQQPFSLNQSSSQLTRFYAHKESTLCLHVFSARLPGEEAETFLKSHEERRKSLQKHIERVQQRTPVLTAAYLKQKGILPGIEMGRILKRAEELSIDENMDDPAELYRRVCENR